MVVVTGGGDIMEVITRARTHLAVILLHDFTTKDQFEQAAKAGLVDIVLLGAN